MIITRKWLDKFVDFKNISNQQISQALNSLGFEVEHEVDYSKLNDELIIGYVEESSLIPDTHLSLNKVNIGSNKILQIVCGAPNVDANQYVIVAKPGTTIANGLTLTEREIKGFKSQGMICALNEIGFSKNILTDLENDSIYAINSSINLKKHLGDSVSLIGLNDYTWEVDLTLNRSDALALIQILKELANYFNLKINWKNLEPVIVKKNKSLNFNFKIDNTLNQEVNTIAYNIFNINNFYQNLKSEDDLFLKHSLIKTTDNLFEDLGNIATIISGQPIILIDVDKLKNSSFELKNIEVIEGEKKLHLVALTQGKDIINLIGKKTEQQFKVDDSTQNILAIYLNINSQVMRKQQKTLNISSIDLQRYMKPLNPNLYDLSNKIYSKLLENYKVFKSASLVKVVEKKYNKKNAFNVSLLKIQELLGVSISFNEIKNLFKTLDFKIELKKDGKINFKIDPNRMDLFGDNDIVEEIARLYGYDNIVEQAPKIIAVENSKDINQKLQRKIGDYLIGLGFNNVKTYSLISKKENETWNLFNIKKPITLLSPLSNLHEQYRLSLFKSLIDVSIYNSSIGNKKVKLWEIADVYAEGDLREKHLSFLVTGNILDDKSKNIVLENNYFYLKSIIENIVNIYNVDMNDISFNVQSDVIDEIHPFINAQIKYKNSVIGYIFKLNPRFENINKINSTIVVELNLSIIEKNSVKKYLFKPISKFQQSTRDISLLVPNKMEYQQITKKLIKNVDNLINIQLIDEYIDDDLISSNQKSLAISFSFNNLEKQMTDSDINYQWEIILKNAADLNLIVR